MADPSYPDDLLYHAEHDWARIDGDTDATFGITWYAQDALGEVVFFDAAQGRRRRSPRTSPTPRSSPSRRSPTCSRRCRARSLAVNEALADKPETINEDPYGEGWLVKVKLTDPAEADALMDAAEYQATLD